MKNVYKTCGVVVLPAIIALLLIAVLYTTDPSRAGSGVILLVFVLIYTLTLSLLFVLLHFGIHWISHLSLVEQDVRRHRELRVGARKAYYTASILAFLPVILLAMRSFTELRFTDVFLVIVLVAILVFYVMKRA